MERRNMGEEVGRLGAKLLGDVEVEELSEVGGTRDESCDSADEWDRF